MKKKLIYEEMWGNYEIDGIQLSHYNDGSLCIDIWNNEDGPIARLTVCLADKKLKENQAYVDTNNCPRGPLFIEKYGFGKRTGKLGYSGFCAYPLYEFDMERLKVVL